MKGVPASCRLESRCNARGFLEGLLRQLTGILSCTGDTLRGWYAYREYQRASIVTCLLFACAYDISSSRFGHQRSRYSWYSHLGISFASTSLFLNLRAVLRILQNCSAHSGMRLSPAARLSQVLPGRDGPERFRRISLFYLQKLIIISLRLTSTKAI